MINKRTLSNIGPIFKINKDSKLIFFKFFFVLHLKRMGDSRAYGLAIITIILLLVAAVLLAYDDRQHDNHRRVEEREVERPTIRLPFDFGAL